MRLRFKNSGGHRGKTFLRVLRSYSLGEKVLSLALLFVVFYVSIDYVRNSFELGGIMDSASGRYSEGIVGEFQRINPLFVDLNSADRAVSKLVFSGLVKYDPKTQKMVDDIAHVELSEDRKTYSFTIKDGIKWHDGQPLTVDDVMFTFVDLIQNPEFPNQILKSNFNGIELIKRDEKHVDFKLKKVNSFFLSNLSVGIVPKHILKDVAVSELGMNEFNNHPIGSGPYMMREPYQKVGKRMEVLLTVNSNYFGKTSSIKEIRLVAFPNYESLIAAGSALNAMDKVLGNLIGEFKENKRFKLFEYELPQYTALFLNQNVDTFKKKKVRLALQKAIDKKKLLESIGGLKAVDTPLMTLKQDEWIYQVNVDEAKGALYDAKYRFKEEGDKYRKDRKGKLLELKLLARGFSDGSAKKDEIQKVVNFVKTSWEAIGIKVNVSVLDPGEYSAALQSRDYDVALAGQSLGYNLDTYSYWHSSQADKGLNLSNYRSFAVDKVIEAIREVHDDKKKQDKLAELGKLISDEIPAVFLYRPVYYYVSDQKVKNQGVKNLVFPSDKFADVSNWEASKD